MAGETMRELQLAVDNFTEVVDGLAEIKSISENAKASADNIGQVYKEMTEYTDELVKSVDKMEALCAQIDENNKRLEQFVSDKLSDAQKAILDSNESAINLITMCNDTVIAKVLDSNKRTVSSISDCVETVRAQTAEYSLSVQKSIDELRLQSTNNARELRDNISYAKADLTVKSDNLQASVNSLLVKSKSERIFLTLGAISAAVAAAASIVGLFL